MRGVASRNALPPSRASKSGAFALALVIATSGIGSNASPAGRRVERIRSNPSSIVPHLRRSTANGCSANYGTAGDFFVGDSASALYDVAGGYLSGVLAGLQDEACGDDAAVLGGDQNVLSPAPNTNSSGAASSAIAGGALNTVTNYDAMIGAGTENEVDGPASFAGAGGYTRNAKAFGNSIVGASSFVGAGSLNAVSGDGSFIGAGGYLYADAGATTAGNQVPGSDSFIGAGDENVVSSNDAFIGSGADNSLSSNFSSILGGLGNHASGIYSAVLGGYGNNATGSYAIVAGGNSNLAAGTLTFVAGYHANASHNGSFVWSDYGSGSAAVKDTANNQFIVRASGGTYVYSNEAGTAGVRLPAGGGAWSNLSDRNAKTKIAPLDDASILSKVSNLPVSTWQYATERGVRHAGPMAQDFYAAFGVGEDDRHITSIDEAGIAFSAIKALYRENASLRSRNAGLEANVASIDARNERRLASLEAAQASRKQRLTSPAGCTTDYGTTGDDFVGVTDANLKNVAGGYGSAVLGGAENEACDSYTAIEGGSGNIIDGAETGASEESTIGGGYSNVVTSFRSMIGAGWLNEADGDNSFIAAGGYAPQAKMSGNLISGSDAFVGAGILNDVIGNGSFIGAGGYIYANSGGTGPGNHVAGTDSFIGTGDQNAVASNDGFIGSGTQNTVSSTATYAAIAGGLENSAAGEYSAVLGGFGNYASGSYGIIPGGNSNFAAGTLSFAAGYHAEAAHNGSFVWSDYSSGSTTIKDAAANQFVVRASGGTYLYSNEAATAGVKLAPGSGAWASLSDRNAKTRVVALDDESILAKLSRLPISTWQYTSERGVRHAGPMAQDFYAAFGIGEDDRHVTSIDEDGIALAAIKALYREQASLRKRHAALEAIVAAQQAATDQRFSKVASEAAAFERRFDLLRASRAFVRPAAQRRRHVTIGCSANYGTAGDYFVGLPNPEIGDIAGGYASAVLAGIGNQACDSDTAIAGGSNIIGGPDGGASNGSVIAGGDANLVTATAAMVGAGTSNEAEGAASFIAGGGFAPQEYESGNLIASTDAFIGAGTLNDVSGNGSMIGAGGYLYSNTGADAESDEITGADSMIGAGDDNSIASIDGFIGSGANNVLTSTASYASIVGGLQNKASGLYSAILGGYGNNATGSYGIVAGGNANSAAGTLTFAAGYHAAATHNGSFVWSDYSSGSTTLKDAAANQFVVRASGGTYVYSNEAATAGVKLAPGSGTWANLSDRNAKTGIVPLSDASVLAKIAALPITTWQYKAEPGIRHVGPMAQDFYAAFGIGEDDRHITSIDEDGIALAAIKALHQENAVLETGDAGVEAEMAVTNAEIRARLSKLETELRHPGGDSMRFP